MSPISKVTEYEKEILELWENGSTGSQIANKIGATRNAVMGKLHRMREAQIISYKSLQRRVSAIKSNVMKAEKKRLKIEELEHVFAPPVEDEDALKIIAEELAPIREKAKPVRFINLGSHSCRYVVEGIFAKDFMFCNEVKKIGSSYCAEHHARCCVPNAITRKKVTQQ